VKPSIFAVICVLTLLAARGRADELSGWSERFGPQRAQRLYYEVEGQSFSKFQPGRAEQRFFLRTICVRQGDRIRIETLHWDNSQPKLGICRIIDGWYLGYELGPYETPGKRAMFATDGASRLGDLLPAALGAFDGFLEDEGASLQQIVKTADGCKVTADTVDNISCIRIDADNSSHGHFTIWLDPAADFLPRRLIVEKQSQHLWSGRRLSEWTNLRPPDSVGKVSCEGLRVVLDAVTLDNVTGRWEALTWQNTRTLAFSDGNEATAVMHGRRVSASFVPTLPKNTFQPDLRDGALLTNLANPQIPYEWTQGEPKPWADRSVVATIDQTAAALRRDLEARNLRR
jgi:hypothetical protein